MSRATLSSLVTVLAAACDPVAGITLRQPLTPSPKVECVETALAASPYVDSAAHSKVERFRRGFTMNFFLRDTVSLPGQPMPPWIELVEERRGTADLRLFIGYFGTTPSQITPAMAERLREVVAPIAEAIRGACAPSSPARPSCRVEGGFGGSRACDVV